jgi:hypothetical protein
LEYAEERGKEAGIKKRKSRWSERTEWRNGKAAGVEERNKETEKNLSK